MRKVRQAAMLTAATMAVALGSAANASAESKFQCAPGETYVMNVMVSAHPYWVPVYQGFKQAADAMGCEVVFSGTPDYDITKQIASFEQDLVKKPAGILLHPMQADPFIEPINRAIESGIDVVTFAADSPKSKRTAYITSDNLAEAKFAAEEIVKQVGDSAEYAVLENPGQSNHDLRVTALISYMEKNYPEDEAGGPAGDQPGQQCRLPSDCLHPAGQPGPRMRSGFQRPAQPKARSPQCSKPRPRC